MNGNQDNRRQLRDYTLVIPAGGEQRVQINGDYVHLMESQGATINVYTHNGDRLDLIEGQGVKINPYQEVFFQNLGDVSRTVRVLVGVGEFKSTRIDGKVNLNQVSESLIGLKKLLGSGVIPGNSNRKKLLVRAELDNPGVTRVAGIPLYPGDAMELSVTGDIAVEADNESVIEDYRTMQFGEYTGGGIYVGVVEVDGVEQHIVLGLQSSETRIYPWKDSRTETPGADSESDGYANTMAIVAEGIDQHPAAKYCLEYENEGFVDWYLPSVEELKLVHENLLTRYDGGFKKFKSHPEFENVIDENTGTWSSTGFGENYAKAVGFNDNAVNSYRNKDAAPGIMTRPARKGAPAEGELEGIVIKVRGDHLSVAEVV